jgi:hypothetical protein
VRGSSEYSPSLATSLARPIHYSLWDALGGKRKEATEIFQHNHKYIIDPAVLCWVNQHRAAVVAPVICLEKPAATSDSRHNS